MFESLETYTGGEMTSNSSLSSKGVRPLDHLGEGLTYPPASNYSQGGFSTSGHSTKGRGNAKSQNTLPWCPRHNVQSTLKHNFRVPPYAPTRPSILPVFKRLAACFDLSRQSLAPVVHALYRHPLTYQVSLSSILSPLDAILHNT